MQLNIIIALLQPTPETYELFDDVMLMGDKKVRAFVTQSGGGILQTAERQHAGLC